MILLLFAEFIKAISYRGLPENRGVCDGASSGYNGKFRVGGRWQVVFVVRRVPSEMASMTGVDKDMFLMSFKSGGFHVEQNKRRMSGKVRVIAR